MTNPYQAPTAPTDNPKQKRRFGIWFLLVFLLMFGGCAMAWLLVASDAPLVPATPVQTKQGEPLD